MNGKQDVQETGDENCDPESPTIKKPVKISSKQLKKDNGDQYLRKPYNSKYIMVNITSSLFK